MKVQPIPPKNSISFGILQEYRPTHYGDYMKGVYKGSRIEVFDAMKKYNQKLIYVSDNNLWCWLKSKLIYIQNGVKKITRSEAR